MMIISVKAISVADNGNGTFSIELPSKPMKEDLIRLIDEHFPNTVVQVHKLLTHEALIACIASDADLMKPKKREEPPYLPPQEAKKKF